MGGNHCQQKILLGSHCTRKTPKNTRTFTGGKPQRHLDPRSSTSRKIQKLLGNANERDRDASSRGGENVFYRKVLNWVEVGEPDGDDLAHPKGPLRGNTPVTCGVPKLKAGTVGRVPED